MKKAQLAVIHFPEKRFGFERDTMDLLKKFSRENAESEYYDRNNEICYDPSIGGDSAIYWSDNPEKEYLACILEMERQKRVAQGRDAQENSLLGLSTQHDILDGHTFGAKSTNNREDSTITSFDREVATSISQDKNVAVDNLRYVLFVSEDSSIPMDIQDERSKQNQKLIKSPPPQQQKSPPQPQPNPPQSHDDQDFPGRIVPPIIYVASPKMEPTTRGTTNASTSISTTSRAQQAWKGFQYILPFAMLCIVLIAVLISILSIQNRNSTVQDSTAALESAPSFSTTPPIPTDPLLGTDVANDEPGNEITTISDLPLDITTNTPSTKVTEVPMVPSISTSQPSMPTSISTSSTPTSGLTFAPISSWHTSSFLTSSTKTFQPTSLLTTQTPTSRPTFGAASSECLLPVVIGPCRLFEYRWYYNTYTGRCETFGYGGCNGNGNNFLTRASCRNECM